MSDIQDLEHHIKENEELVERKAMALRLYDNRDFKKLFVEGYFTTEAARLVQLSADPSLDTHQRADALNMAQATGHMKRYLSMMVQMGNHAERELPHARAELDELRAAEDDRGSATEDQWGVE